MIVRLQPKSNYCIFHKRTTQIVIICFLLQSHVNLSKKFGSYNKSIILFQQLSKNLENLHRELDGFDMMYG